VIFAIYLLSFSEQEWLISLVYTLLHISSYFHSNFCAQDIAWDASSNEDLP